MTLVSIVWPYWERFEAAFTGLRNMAASYPSADLEIVIVDDGSPTQPALPLADFPAPWPVRVVTLPTKRVPKNPCVPLNAGVKAAQGEVILLTNPETTHRASIVGSMLEELERSGPQAYVLAGVWCPETSEWHCHSQHANMGYHFCTMLRKELFWAAGGFDGDYRDGAGYDDPDFVFRLKRAGARFVFRDDLVADHHKTGAKIDWPPGSAERNRAIFYRKWNHPRTREADHSIQNFRGGPSMLSELAGVLAKVQGVAGRRGRIVARRFGRAIGLTRLLRGGKKTVLHLERPDVLGLPRRLHAATNALPESRWRSLGTLRFGYACEPAPGQDLGLAREADVLHFHGLELWERLRSELPPRPAVVTVYGEWDRMCLPLVSPVPLTVTAPELIAGFPGASYVPPFLLEGEVPALVLSRSRTPSVIHPTGEFAGSLAEIEALRAAVPNARVFIQPALESRVEAALLLDKIRFFDACWCGDASTLSTLLAVAVGTIPLNLSPAACDELARFFGAAPFESRGVLEATKLLSSEATTLASERRRLREFWEQRWQSRHIVARYLAVYDLA